MRVDQKLSQDFKTIAIKIELEKLYKNMLLENDFEMQDLDKAFYNIVIAIDKLKELETF